MHHPPEDVPDPRPVYDESLYNLAERRCPMACCTSIVLEDYNCDVQPLTWWLDQETTKERRATLKAMLIPLGVTTTRGVPRYTCANLDDTDPENMICRAYRNNPDFCAGFPDKECAAGDCYTCGLGACTDNRITEATFVSPEPAVNSQHLAGNLPIGLLPFAEQRIEDR